MLTVSVVFASVLICSQAIDSLETANAQHLNELSCILFGGEFCNNRTIETTATSDNLAGKVKLPKMLLVDRTTKKRVPAHLPNKIHDFKNIFIKFSGLLVKCLLTLGNFFQSKHFIRSSREYGNVVRVEAYVEAQCGDSTRFTRRQLWPVYEKFAKTKRFDVSVIVFGKASCQPVADDYSCRCQHGQRECDLNQLMNCVQDFYNNDALKYLPVFACIQGKTDLDYAKDYCIATNPELPLETIIKCATGRRGRFLLALAGKKTAKLDPPLNNVPLLYLDGEKSIDAFYNLEEAVCNKMQPKPAECAK
ncbi:unnamed protein product [Enterobius vermicularis]|uniref:Uncharacterized protein n=1 Tax=Enterobius vermicularis TaxID=51028 RepID=A0A0N4V1L6_ENTVE|nr:unnamed protein product [Enterobius vermicularis]